MTHQETFDTVLPPGLSEGEFSRALEAFADAVGSDGVLRLQEQVEEYFDPYFFGDTRTFVPSAAAMPRTVEEVRAVLAVANEYGIPLWTVSQGRNYAYGGAAPRVRGSVVLDLKRMNRVLEINEECGYALVEPGVRFFDLYEHLREGGYDLWVSVPDLGWGSIIGNTLERGFGYTPYGDHSQFQCGMEVVLVNGDVVRMGMGAATNSTAWQLYKGGYGPSHDGLFMQSNFGVVTKMGVWLMPRPKRAIACTLKAQEEADLGPVIEALRPLLLGQIIQSNVQVGNALAIASMISGRDQWFDGDGPLPDAVVKEITQHLGLGWWNAKFGLYGTKELADARLKAVQKAFERIPGAELVFQEYPGDVGLDEVHPTDRSQVGVPSLDLIRMAAWRGCDPAHTDFSLVCPPTGSDAVRQARLIRKRVEEFGFDYAGGFTTNPRHAIALCLISFDKSNAEERARVAELFPLLVRDVAREGYAPYRSHLAFMDLIAVRYDFNDHASMRLNETIKDALDPNGILSPGKQGIWPSSMRAGSNAHE